MTLLELVSIPFDKRSILVIGRPSAGKTHLSKILEPMYPHHHVIHTDDFLKSGTANSIIEILDEHEYCKPSIIEGMTGFSLLEWGERTGKYKPEVVIFCEISAGKQREIYLGERDPLKLKHQKSFWTKCLSIYQKWEKIVQDKPIIYTYSYE
jgi:hypothetical protein